MIVDYRLALDSTPENATQKNRSDLVELVVNANARVATEGVVIGGRLRMGETGELTLVTGNLSSLFLLLGCSIVL